VGRWCGGGQDREQDEIKHALAVRSAVSLGNYHRLAKLYRDAPNMGAFIMDHFMDRERVRTLRVIAKT
jgi:SAC3 family protein LENG8/THP3